MTSTAYASHFSARNIPFGIATSDAHPAPQAVTRLGNSVLFLNDLHDHGLFDGVDGLPSRIFAQPALNGFTALGRSIHQAVRKIIQDDSGNDASNIAKFPSKSVEDITEVTLHLPVTVGDFTDFSCSLHHVIKMATIMTGDSRPPPAFFHMPVAYQGRASSVVVSGTDIERPMGQFYDPSKPRDSPGGPSVIFGPSRKLDYELEFATVIGKPLPMRQRLKAVDADDHIFGFVLMNDWSSRDIQGFEMMPLGPLNGKSFGTTISPWVVTIDALEDFTAQGPEPTIVTPSHLQDSSRKTYNVRAQVELLAGSDATVLGVSSVQAMYWSARQMAAHLASAGSPLRSGDLLATGTISGYEDEERASIIERTEGGTKPVKLQDGTERRFLEDGDIVRITAVAGDDASGVGFGECIGKVLPSRPF